MKLEHARLTNLLQRAYSAERAAAIAYEGHAKSVSCLAQKEAICQIEQDEWAHRRSVLAIMQQYGIPVSNYLETKFVIIGRLIYAACFLIGWFMPFYFAGRLESGNVCEYFRMMQYFEELGIQDHHAALYEMGLKEKEHEEYFLARIESHRFLPWFERIFSWGRAESLNDIDMSELRTLAEASQYCRRS